MARRFYNPPVLDAVVLPDPLCSPAAQTRAAADREYAEAMGAVGGGVIGGELRW